MNGQARKRGPKQSKYNMCAFLRVSGVGPT